MKVYEENFVQLIKIILLLEFLLVVIVVECATDGSIHKYILHVFQYLPKSFMLPISIGDFIFLLHALSRTLQGKLRERKNLNRKVPIVPNFPLSSGGI